MDYFKDMVKDTRVFSMLVLLSVVVSLPVSWMIRELFQYGFMLTFISSYFFGIVIVFTAFFLYAVRKENMINNGY